MNFIKMHPLIPEIKTVKTALVVTQTDSLT